MRSLTKQEKKRNFENFDQILLTVTLRRRTFHEPNLIRIWTDPNLQTYAC